MKRTVYIPTDLARRVEAYLARHPGVTLSAFVQEALEERVRPANPREILRLAGLVTRASTTARDRRRQASPWRRQGLRGAQ
jgi:inactivated superfamily I helicase